jgi:hypothetical protein
VLLKERNQLEGASTCPASASQYCRERDRERERENRMNQIKGLNLSHNQKNIQINVHEWTSFQ